MSFYRWINLWRQLTSLGCFRNPRQVKDFVFSDTVFYRHNLGKSKNVSRLQTCHCSVAVFFRKSQGKTRTNCFLAWLWLYPIKSSGLYCRLRYMDAPWISLLVVFIGFFWQKKICRMWVDCALEDISSFVSILSEFSTSKYQSACHFSYYWLCQ